MGTGADYTYPGDIEANHREELRGLRDIPLRSFPPDFSARITKLRKVEERVLGAGHLWSRGWVPSLSRARSDSLFSVL